MSDNNRSITLNGGIIAVTIVFVILKLVGGNPIAGLDWLWVLSPLWIGILLTVAWVLIVLVLTLVFGAGVGVFAFANRPRGPRMRAPRARGGYQGLPNNDKNFVNFTAPRKPQR